MGQFLAQIKPSPMNDLSSSLAIPQHHSQHQVSFKTRITNKFFESIVKSDEDDMIIGCHLFQKKGFKPVRNLPIQEVCFGISEISSFVECIAANNPNMKNLKKLSMHWNILSYQDLEIDFSRLHSQVEKLSYFLRRIRSLEHIVFRISRNHPKSLLSAFKKVVRNKQMKKLDFELQASKFQKSDITRITKLLKEAINLRELSLSFKRCLLSDDSFTELFECLYGLNKLKQLRINFIFTANAVEYQIEQMIKIPEKLSQLEGLWINMGGTDIEESYVKRMMEEFGKHGGMNQFENKNGLCRRASFFLSPSAKKQTENTKQNQVKK